MAVKVQCAQVNEVKPKLYLEEQIKAKVDKMAQWLKELANYAWIPRFDPQIPDKGGRRE